MKGTASVRCRHGHGLRHDDGPAQERGLRPEGPKHTIKMSSVEFSRQLVDLRNPLFYFALSLTHDRDDASDLVQESMLRALTYSDKFRENTDFKAWIYTIMKNTFINAHRRNKRTGRVMEHVDRVRQQASLVETPATSESKIRMSEINGALGRLDDIFRTPFQMHHDGYKYNEIADELSIPVGTVKSRIHQARQRLMGMLS